MPHVKRLGFTLIELLVVVTIIVILLALLTPAMDKALYQAEKMLCLTQQKNIVTSSLSYAMENKRYLPPNKMPGRGSASSYDIRTWKDDQGTLWPYSYPAGGGTSGGPSTPLPIGGVTPGLPSNLQLGLLPEFGFLPKEQLGKILHCPTLDNSGNPHTSFDSGALRDASVTMDVVHDFGYGASWYNDSAPGPRSSRIIIGYNYRAASYELKGGSLNMGRMGSGFLVTVDMPDQRFSGLARGPGSVSEDNLADLRIFGHPDGWGRSFGDGHVSFLDDVNYDVAWEQFRRNSWGNMSGVQEPNVMNEEWIYSKLLSRE